MTGLWINRVDEELRTPLDRAAHSDHMALTELLLRQEAEDSAANLEGSSVLHIAAYLGLHEAVDSLLQQGKHPNEKDHFGETPLHKAAKNGHYEVVRLLTAYGADVNELNMLGLSPLHWVALNGQALIAEHLIEMGADPKLADDYLDGLTPLQLARIMGYEAVVRVLDK